MRQFPAAIFILMMLLGALLGRPYLDTLPLPLEGRSPEFLQTLGG
jgi:hypothetical protein